MRRALALLLAMVAGLALAPAGADARCAKKRCMKMTGQRVLLLPITAPPTIGSTASIPDPTPSPAPPTPEPAARLGVVAREWSLVLSRATLPAGRALVQLQNFGEDAHNLRIERADGSGAAVDVPEAESGERTTGDAALSPGEYRIYCSLPGHEAQGMRARLTVTQ